MQSTKITVKSLDLEVTDYWHDVARHKSLKYIGTGLELGRQTILIREK